MLCPLKRGAGVFCLLAALFCTAPYAHADSLTVGPVIFTVASGGPAPTGSFVFDDTTNTFTSFQVFWDGAVFVFLPPPGGLTFAEIGGSSASWCGTGFGNTFAQCGPGTFGFNFSIFGSTILLQPTFSDNFAAANGTYTLAFPTPEPSSLALVLLGMTVVPLMRKRKGQGLPQTS